MFDDVNRYFRKMRLNTALFLLVMVCFMVSVITSGMLFWSMNGQVPPNFLVVVAVTSLVVAVPMVCQSMPTIRTLQQSRDKLRQARNELSKRVEELDIAYCALEEARSELESRVEERTRALNEARTLAEGANQAKSSFLAHMSHELRTPLNAVIGFSELLVHPSVLPQKRKLELVTDYATTINRSGRHLLSLVNDLLDLSKIEAGEMVLYPEYIDMSDFAETVQATMLPLIREKSQVFDLDISDAPEIIFTDRRALLQIVLNLLSNSSKYSESGCPIQLSIAELDQNIALVFRDQGCGMADHKIEEALKPFFRIPDPGIATEGGTGLGLAIVVQLIEAQNGTLAIDSTPGKGTCIRITLPIPQPEIPTRPDAGEQPSAP